MSLVLEKRIPTIKWYQIYNNVYFNLYIQNLSKDNIQITNNKFNLNINDYQMEFEFNDEINAENIEFKETEKYLSIVIEKINNEQWKHLTKNNLYKNNIKVDWDHWFDEDAEDDENVQEQMDFSQMMGGGMPGMDGFNMEEMMANMGNNEDDDEDNNEDDEDNNEDDEDDNEDDEDNNEDNNEDDNDNEDDEDDDYEDMPELIDDDQEFDYEEAAQLKGELEEYYEELEENNRNNDNI